jgi:hypothetical protein
MKCYTPEQIDKLEKLSLKLQSTASVIRLHTESAKLTSEERKERAKKAIATRWKKSTSK